MKAYSLKIVLTFKLTFIFHSRITSPDCPLLKLLGKNTAFETTVGSNGRIWVNSKSTIETITIINAISAAEYMTNEQITAMCRKLADVFVKV